MHLPDGILSATPLTVGLALVGIGGAAVALRKARFERPADVAWGGTIAAFVLAVQAVNIPLVPGASAHAIGATLAALTLGPARAVIALVAVLIIQALLFADGGITVLGINALTIAILPVLAVTLFRRWFQGAKRGLELAAVAGCIAGNAAGAGLLALLLVEAAAAPPMLTVSWLVGVHVLSAVAEGVLTALALRRVAARAPHLIAQAPALDGSSASRGAYRTAAVALVVVLLLLPFASDAPDALQLVLSQLQVQK